MIYLDMEVREPVKLSEAPAIPSIKQVGSRAWFSERYIERHVACSYNPLSQRLPTTYIVLGGFWTLFAAAVKQLQVMRGPNLKLAILPSLHPNLLI